MATKKRTAKRTTHKKATPMKSFRVEKDTIPFFHTKPTLQTIYWLLLLLAIVMLDVLILRAQMDVSTLSNLITTTL